jgi:hypothetical protein
MIELPPRQPNGSQPSADSDFVIGEPTTSATPQKRNYSLAEIPLQAAISAPSDVVDIAKSTYNAFKPSNISSTLGGLGDVLAGGTRAAAKAILPEKAFNYIESFDAPETTQRISERASAAGQQLADQYGGYEEIKRSLAEHPVSTAMDAATILTGGGTIASRAPGLAGRLGETAIKAGQAIDPLTGTVKALSVLPKATAVPLWWKTGASYKSLDDAARAGLTGNPVFMDHLRGAASAEDMVNSIDDAVKTISKDASDNYVQKMGNMAQGPLPFDKIDDAYNKAYGEARSLGKIKDQSMAAAVNEVKTEIDNWKNQSHPMANNIQDMDALKQRIDEIIGNYRGDSRAQKILGEIRKSVFDTISSKDKNYANLMDEYSKYAKQIKELRQELVGQPGSQKTMASRIRKIIGAQSKAEKQGLLDQIAKINPDIPFMVAGQELSAGLPYGMRGYLSNMATYGAAGIPGLIAGAAASSPKIAGGTQYGIGRTIGLAKQAIDAVPQPIRLGAYQYGQYSPTNMAPEGEQNTGPALPEGQDFFIGELPQARASGGRTVSSAKSKAEQLINMVDKVKKEESKETKPLLNLDDNTVAKALAVANQHI